MSNTLAVDDTENKKSRELIDYIESIGEGAGYITNEFVKSRKDYVKKYRR